MYIYIYIVFSLYVYLEREKERDIRYICACVYLSLYTYITYIRLALYNDSFVRRHLCLTHITLEGERERVFFWLLGLCDFMLLLKMNDIVCERESVSLVLCDLMLWLKINDIACVISCVYSSSLSATT